MLTQAHLMRLILALQLAALVGMVAADLSRRTALDTFGMGMAALVVMFPFIGLASTHARPDLRRSLVLGLQACTTISLAMWIVHTHASGLSPTMLLLLALGGVMIVSSTALTWACR